MVVMNEENFRRRKCMGNGGGDIMVMKRDQKWWNW